MRTRVKVFGFMSISILFALNLFSGSLVLGDVRASNLINLTTKSDLPANTIYCQDFEYGWLGWWADNGVWEVGQDSLVVPHSGDSLAGTVLNNKFPDYQNSRLISPPINLPNITSTEALRLRFWHWFLLGYGDQGLVQISVDSAGVWQPWLTISNYYQEGSSVWSACEVEISKYAGKRVRFGFYLLQASWPTSGTNWGWYVDDICVLKTPVCVSAPLCLDLEDGWGDWWADNGVWEVGHPDTVVVPHSGQNCAGTVLNKKYPEWTSSHLISPVTCLPNIDTDNEALYLEFWHWFKMAGYDVGQVQISVDSIGVWKPWVTISNNFTGASAVWSPVNFRISQYAEKRVRFGFYLLQGSWPSSGVDWGWYVDDVCVAIRPDSIKVLNPKGGECWGIGIGQPHKLNWNWNDWSGTFQYVKIELSTDAGKTWGILVDSASNNGFWQDTIPNSYSYSDSCLIRLSDAGDGTPACVSDAVFSMKQFQRGDANADGQITVADVVYLVSYLFKGGASPKPLEAGNANSDNKVTVADVVYLVSYLFKGGSRPACTT